MAIKQIVELCQVRLGEDDLFGRYGGEEFIIYLPRTEKPEAIQLAEELRSLIEHSPVGYDGVSIHLTASFGVTEATSYKSLEKLIREADHALYEAKRGGRNRVVADPSD